MDATITSPDGWRFDLKDTSPQQVVDVWKETRGSAAPMEAPTLAPGTALRITHETPPDPVTGLVTWTCDITEPGGTAACGGSH